MPREVSFAVPHMTLLMQWFVLRAKRFSRLLRFLTSRLAAFVPYFWSLARNRA
jgi:hypothetical protein